MYTTEFHKVGELFDPARTQFQIGAHYNFIENSHMLSLFYDRPTTTEIKDIRIGRAEFRFYVSYDVIFLVYAFGTPIMWCDAPYSWHMNPMDKRTIPAKLESGQMPLLSIFLVDATSGVLHAIRSLTMEHKFSNALHDAIQEQAARPFDQDDYDRQLYSIYDRYSSSQLANLAQYRCVIKGKY